MTCLGVPVVVDQVLAILPGEERLEFALHARWRFGRIDAEREFFWINAEMAALITAYAAYTASLRDDPWSR